MASPKAALADLKELFPEVELRILRAALFIHGSDIQKASEYLLDEVCPGNARRSVSSETARPGNVSLGTGTPLPEIDAPGTTILESGPDLSAVKPKQPLATGPSAEPPSVPLPLACADSSPAGSLVAIGQSDVVNSSPVGAANDLLAAKEMDISEDRPDVVRQKSEEEEEEEEEEAEEETEEEEEEEEEEEKEGDNNSRAFHHLIQVMSRRNDVNKRSLEASNPSEETDLAASQDPGLISSTIEEEMVLEAGASSMHGDGVIGGESSFLSALIGSGSICQSLGSVCEPVNVKEFDAALEQADTVKDLQEQFLVARSLESAVRNAEEAARMAEIESVCGGKEVEEKVREIVEAVARAKEESQAKSAKNLAEKGVISEDMAVLQRDLQKAIEGKTSCEKSLAEIHLSLQGRVRKANERVAAAHAQKQALEHSAQNHLREEQQNLEVAVAELRALTNEEMECRELQKFVTSRVEAVDKLQGEVDLLSEDVEMMKIRLGAYHSSTASSSSSKGHPLTLIDSVRDRLLELHSESPHLSTHTPGSPASPSPGSVNSEDANLNRGESIFSNGRPYTPSLQMGGGGGSGMGPFGKKVEEGEEDWVNVEGSGGKSSASTSGSSHSSIRSN